MIVLGQKSESMSANNPFEHIRLFGENFGQRHAIEIVNFIVSFAAPIDASDHARFEDHRGAIQDMFASVEALTGVQIQFNVNSPQPSVSSGQPPTAPKVLTEFARNGAPRWTATFGDQNQIVVSSRAYDGWEAVWPEAKRRLAVLLECIDQYKPVRSIEHSVTDTFSSPTERNALVCKNFFVENPHLPTHLLEYGDPRWDISHGWFDDFEGDSQKLVRFDARGFLQNQLTVFSVSNLNALRPDRFQLLRDYLANDAQELESSFSNFHEANKEFLRKILHHQLLRKMGL
ncbi:TIGR04255 family protein [Aestuariibius insulae]|uniref:TIGR04255 family protein n=1 Tax=Aestuariibius insulae TaxID=2058287 RepID=UPI00345EC025